MGTNIVLLTNIKIGVILLFITNKLTKSILDPIHGLIRTSAEEMEIISHPLFNRLRKIKQNTFLYYVFPSANHTRFEHSIGVMHLASKMFLNAFYNANTLKEKQKKYKLQVNKNILFRESITNLEDLFLDLRIAALLHDIGHGPMSHLFDKFAPSNKEFLEMVKKDESILIDRRNILADSFEKILTKPNELSKNVEHEYVSLYFSLSILKDIGLKPNRIKRILTIMNEKINLWDEKINSEQNTYNIIPFLNQIVVGAPLDCDRMDYLLRDSYFTGVKYGSYDLNRLLKSLLPFIDNEEKVVILGIKKSGLPAIENFLQARNEMFVQVYFHKTNCAANTMLSYATKDFKQGEFLNCTSPEEFKLKYLELSDENFLNLITGNLTGDEKKVMENLMNRRLWKRVVEIYPGEGILTKENISCILKKIKTYIKNNFNISNIEDDFVLDNPLKDIEERKTELLKKDEDENYYIDSEGGWIKESKIFKALSNEYAVGRLYLGVDTNIPKHKELFRKIKKEVQKLMESNCIFLDM